MGNHRFHSFLFGVAGTITVAALIVICTCVFLAASGYKFSVRKTAEDLGTENPSTGMRKADSTLFSSEIQSDSPVLEIKNSSSALSSFREKDRNLVLVSPSNHLPDWYKPDLTTAFGVRMDSSVVKPYTEMRAAALKEGVSLWISSAYRSDELQEKLFRQAVEKYSKKFTDSAAAETFAEQSVAKPGYSEHATGLALDLNGVKGDFDGTSASSWLDRHAAEYGFILRYPKDKQKITKIKYEPWHYRYVGTKNAQAIKKSGMCLEEYLAALQKIDVDN